MRHVGECASLRHLKLTGESRGTKNPQSHLNDNVLRHMNMGSNMPCCFNLDFVPLPIWKRQGIDIEPLLHGDDQCSRRVDPTAQQQGRPGLIGHYCTVFLGRALTGLPLQDQEARDDLHILV